MNAVSAREGALCFEQGMALYFAAACFDACSSGCSSSSSLVPAARVFDGVILTDQIKNLDWRARRMDVVGKVPEEVVNECLDKIHTFL